MIFFDRKIQRKNVIFTYKTFPHSPPYHFKTAIFHSFWSFSEVKKHFSETTKGVIGKKLLGSNRPYMSYPMKFSFYLHQTYGYWHNWEKLKKFPPKSKSRVFQDFLSSIWPKCGFSWFCVFVRNFESGPSSFYLSYGHGW